MHVQVAEFAFARPRDVGWSGQRARLLGDLAGLSPRKKTAFAKSVERIVKSTIDHGSGGTIRFDFLADDDLQFVSAVVRRDLSGTAATNESPPENWEPDRNSMDRWEHERTEHAEVIRLGQALPRTAAPITADAASEWATPLATRNMRGALSVSQHRIGELATNLRSAQEHGLNLERELANIRALNETLELLALVASKTENAVIILDDQQRIEWINDSFVRMTGYEIGEVREQHISSVLHGSDQQSESVRELQVALDGGHGISQEILHHGKDGRTYWASISITPVFNDEGTIGRWIGIASDATRRRHAQEALRQAKDEAESSSRAKSEFVANMSHEIRTPMNIVIGMTELALETKLDEEQREYLSSILDAAESLLRLLNDILDLSKIEARKLEIEHVAFPLAQTLRDALRPFVFQAKQKNVDLDLSLPLSLPENLIGDPVRVRQIIANLVGNAIKFTHQGEVRVAVREVPSAADGVTLGFAVRDSGVGIPADKLEQIFEAFTQADSSTTRRFGGTGLGLNISMQLVEMMGGRIWAASEEGVGSTFEFELPFQPMPAGSILTSEIAGLDPMLAHSGAETSVGRQLKILVADDNRANRRLACKILEKRDHQVHEAESGTQVIDALRKETFDVVLLDVQMPGMDGLETTALIRQLKHEIPFQPYIVALTAHAMQGDRERCLAAGMDAYMAKPLRAKQLLALMDAAAISSGPSTTLDAPASASEFDFSPALERLEGDKSLLLEQMQYYLEDSPILIRDIADGIAQKDGKKLQMAAHRMRGLSAGFDAHLLTRMAAELEGIGNRGTPESAAIIATQLTRCWQQLQTVIEEEVRRAEPSD